MALTRRDFLATTGAATGVLIAAAAAGRPSPSAHSAARDGWTLPPKRPFRVIENEWITVSDGTRLGVRLWIPQAAEHRPVPVVWEYLPYRKRDGVRKRDDATAQNLAPYGIAFARVDIRGTGESGGVMTDEYGEPELNDGVECVAWLAGRPWCNGSVGMRGISWGGINSLQIASRAPPALKAIMPMGCVDNRFLGDAHYIGGALATENFKWGAYFKVYMAAPPDPQISGPDWENIWRERLDATPAILQEWTSHQRYDEYWRRGSVAADYHRIQCPVYVVGGWLDPYSNVVGSLLAGLNVPRKGLIGPWVISCRTCPHHWGWIGHTKKCGGGNSGWRASTPESWTSPCCAPTCLTGHCPRSTLRRFRVDGWPRPRGRPRPHRACCILAAAHSLCLPPEGRSSWSATRSSVCPNRSGCRAGPMIKHRTI